MPSAKTVARVLGRIESRMLSQLLHDPRHINGRKPARLNLAVRLTARKAGPSVTAASSSQDWTARTGHVSGFEPYGMPTLRPAPSRSVLLRRKVTVRPSRLKAKSTKSSATSSERRNAPANPSRSSARSRAPIKPASVAPTTARISSYSATAKSIAREQVALAGARLAKIMETELK
jgi:hypothetical protein